ncbi:hypothetical protein, partial [Paraburkholderia sp. GAS448]|uniref:hypothetical protein n=1 Tax=Paraburkholderia sp. GAS448 TaxID=3035136 RepID=UPI003D260916
IDPRRAPHRSDHPPAPPRPASLHQQQRNEIMKNFRYVVNRFFNRPSLPTTSQSLANPGFPLPRAFF